MFTQGNIIKMNPELFAGNESLTDTFGQLGVPGLFRHAIFEVQKTVSDGRGEGLLAKLTNAEKLKSYITGVKDVKSEGDWYFLQAEMVRANTKITLDYEVAELADTSGKVEALFLARKKLRNQGKDKKHKDMMANWKEIEIARGNIKGKATAELVDVVLPKQHLTIKVSRNVLPKDGDEKSLLKFKEVLMTEVIKFRRERKVIHPFSDKNPLGIVTKDLYGKSMTLLGGVHTEAGQPLACFKHFMRNWHTTPKKPTNPKATYVGIEIEMLFSGNVELFRKLLFEAGLYRNVSIVDDNSVRSCHNVNYRGTELQILCTTAEVKHVLESLQKVFNDPNIDGYANRSCGLHIHGDMRGRDHKLVYKNLVRVQDILRGSQPRGRINNIHCRANTTDVFKTSEGERREDRYWVINPDAFKDHTTLEVRIHEGTVDCKDIYNWLVFLDCIMSYKAEIPVNKFTLASQLNDKYKLGIPESAIQYVDSRVKKFNSLSAS